MHGAHQFIGVQAALHQCLGLALAHELHGHRGRRDTVRRIDDVHASEIDVVGGGDLVDPLDRADENRRDQAEFRGLDRAFERTVVARVHDGRRRGRDRLADVDQVAVLRVFRVHRIPSWCVCRCARRFLARRVDFILGNADDSRKSTHARPTSARSNCGTNRRPISHRAFVALGGLRAHVPSSLSRLAVEGLMALTRRRLPRSRSGIARSPARR